MPEQAMAEWAGVSRSVDAYAIVILQGNVTKLPELNELPGQRGEVCQSEIESGGLTLTVIGRKENARVLAAIGVGSDVRVAGTLVQQSWRTGESEQTRGHSHQRLAVEASMIHAITLPQTEDVP